MKLHTYNCINANNEVIKVIKIGRKDIKIASKKLKFLFGKNACFIKLQYKGAKNV